MKESFFCLCLCVFAERVVKVNPLIEVVNAKEKKVEKSLIYISTWLVMFSNDVVGMNVYMREQYFAVDHTNWLT